MQNLIEFDPNMTINDVVARFPVTMPILNRFGFDLCCGGGLSIAEATQRDGIDLESVLASLRAVLHQQ